MLTVEPIGHQDVIQNGVPSTSESLILTASSANLLFSGAVHCASRRPRLERSSPSRLAPACAGGGAADRRGGLRQAHVKPVDPGKLVEVVNRLFQVAGSVRVRTERGNRSARSRNLQSEASLELPGPKHATAHSLPRVQIARCCRLECISPLVRREQHEGKHE